MSDPETNDLLDEIDDLIAEASATAEECEELLEELHCPDTTVSGEKTA